MNSLMTTDIQQQRYLLTHHYLKSKREKQAIIQPQDHMMCVDIRLYNQVSELDVRKLGCFGERAEAEDRIDPTRASGNHNFNVAYVPVYVFWRL